MKKCRARILYSIILLLLMICFAGCKSHSNLDKETDVEDKAKESDIVSKEELYISEQAYIQEPSEQDVVSYEGLVYVNGELILHALAGTEREAVVSLIKKYNGKIIGEIAATDTYQVRFEGEYSYEELTSLLYELEEDELISWGSINTVFEAENDYYPESDSEWSSEWNDGAASGLNWGVEAILAPDAWEYRDYMDYVNVGIYDCCFYEHEDLNYRGLYFNDTKLCVGDGSQHGTHVAGIIGAGFDNNIGISGVAPYTNLYGVSYSSPNLANHDLLIRYELALAQLIIENECKVINISQNTGRDRSFAASMGNQAAIDSIEADAAEIGRYLDDIINRGYQNFVICVAAGNANDTNYVSDSSEQYGYRVATKNDSENEILRGNVQAKYNNFLNAVEIETVKDQIIVVGASRNNGDGTYTYSDFSDIGERVDVVAPGEHIYSTIDNNAYANDIWSGTSMAAPHVSGVATMLFSVDDSLTGQEVKKIIKDAAIIDIAGCDYKMINANEAVSRALGNSYYDQATVETDGSGKTQIKESLSLKDLCGNYWRYTTQQNYIYFFNENGTVREYNEIAIIENREEYILEGEYEYSFDGSYLIIKDYRGCGDWNLTLCNSSVDTAEAEAEGIKEEDIFFFYEKGWKFDENDPISEAVCIEMLELADMPEEVKQYFERYILENNDVGELSEEECLTIAKEYWKGYRGDDYMITPPDKQEHDGKNFYYFVLKWYVDDHWSAIDYLFIDSTNGDCYFGINEPEELIE